MRLRWRSPGGACMGMTVERPSSSPAPCTLPSGPALDWTRTRLDSTGLDRTRLDSTGLEVHAEGSGGEAARLDSTRLDSMMPRGVMCQGWAWSETWSVLTWSVHTRPKRPTCTYACMWAPEGHMHMCVRACPRAAGPHRADLCRVRNARLDPGPWTLLRESRDRLLLCGLWASLLVTESNPYRMWCMARGGRVHTHWAAA